MEEQQYTEDKVLIKTARIVSAIFAPIHIPLLAFLALFLFSYLRIMPLAYKALVLGVVAGFTILLPVLLVYLFHKISRRIKGSEAWRNQHYIPLLLTAISYVACLQVMFQLHLPWYLNNIIVTAQLVLAFCVIAALWRRLSEHMAGMGVLIGGLVAFSELFHYNPVYWLCVFILIAGFLGTARIVLRRHTLGEVLGGLAVGLLCSLLFLHPNSLLLMHLYSQALP